jgi:hypothetical protein
MSYENYGGNFPGNGQEQPNPNQGPGGHESAAPGQNNSSGAPPMQFPPADGQAGQAMPQGSGQPGTPGDNKTTLW